MIQKITIVDGNPDSGKNPLNSFIEELTLALKAGNSHVDIFHLSEKNIKQCIGCWDCWWKTPGVCRFNDDAPETLKSIINSDLVIYSSPMIMGMYSAILKKFHDRTIPLVHPYIKIVEGEYHHKKRYPNYPKMGVLVEPNDSSKEELELVEKIFSRIKLNFHSEVKFFYSINSINPKQLSHEISHL
ncbi:flavodoxin family protein [Maribellus maritimus]|uniref:flavodoxin family protein n=1 Tax=Maribellus maritimus TaxID=2870838 RepID=UPI001EEB26D0|nr:flavodoxin family protein [Maribellus maritimus]MCG6188482.1 flavodoxin family protein [Maribellus maritimus]